MANISKLNFNGEALDVKDTYARDQLLHLTADSHKADVTGDYTVNAENVTTHATGDYTVTAGDIAMTSANTTMHTTADRTIDTDGNDSVHIDGASTLNVGGLRTETFAGDKTEAVTGTTTEKSQNRNTTVTGKWSVNLSNKTFDMKDVTTEKDVDDKITAAIKGVSHEHNGVITIGDSYGRGEGGGVTDKYTPWTSLIKQYLGLTDGVNYWTRSMSGAGFSVAEQSKKFEQILSDLGDTMTEIERNSIGKILVAGGYNDSKNKAPEKLTPFFNVARSKFPNAVVYTACIGWSTERQAATDIFNNSVRTYTVGAGINGGVYIVNSQYSLHNYTWFDDDGIHPNDEGQKHIAEVLASGLLYGSCNNKYSLAKISITPNTSICDTCDITGYCMIENGITSLLFNFNKNIVFNRPINTNATILIGTLNCDLLNAIQDTGYCSIPATAYCTYNTDKHFNPVVNFWLSRKSLYMNIINTSADESSFKNLGTLGTMNVRLLNTTLMTGYC